MARSTRAPFKGRIQKRKTAAARTVRGGETRMIAADQLVPGDVVLLESGDKVPADLRLADVNNFRTEEAALTGELVPADKTTEAVSANATVGDRECMAFSGTMVAPAVRLALWSRRVVKQS